MFTCLVYLSIAKAQYDSLTVPLFDSVSNCYGYIHINDSSTYLIPPKYDNAYHFYGDCAEIRMYDKIGLINRQGSILFQSNYKWISVSYKGFILAKDTVLQLANIYGQPIFEVDEYSIFWHKEITQKLDDNNVKDAELIQRVLEMYSDPLVRCTELMNTMYAFEDIGIIVLKHIYEILERLYDPSEIDRFRSKSYNLHSYQKEINSKQ